MTLQSMCICIEIFIAAIVYVIMQFWALPDSLVIIAHAAWICVHGDTPIVYLILNESLRKAMFKLIRDLYGKANRNILINNRITTEPGTPGPSREEIRYMM
uniref:Uncharacterized protein n=1 Tax=Acrobeloides nanus TaxID=290746 RepID=A0A914E3T7_9BILA